MAQPLFEGLSPGKVWAPGYLRDAKWAFWSGWAWTGLLLVPLAALLVVGAAATQGLFLSGRNLENMAGQLPYYLAALPFLALVFSRGGYDFSVGMVAGTAGALFVLAASAGVPLWLAAAEALAVAGLVGAFAGALVGFARIPGAMATIVLAFALRGINIALMADGNSALAADGLDDASAYGAALVLASAAVACWVAWRRQRDRAPSPAGEALWRSWPFAASALCAGAAGILLACRLQSATPVMGSGLEMETLAMVVVGGTMFAAGRPNVPGALLAGVIFVCLKNIMNLTGVDYAIQSGVTAALLALGLLAQFVFHLVAGLIHRAVSGQAAAAGADRG